MARHSYKRSDRLAHLLHREIGNIVQLEVSDPRLQFVTVTKVRLSDDLKEATVYFSIMGEDKQKALESLRHAGSFIRACIGRRCYLKYVPCLSFRLDETLEKAARIDRILDSIHTEQDSSFDPSPEDSEQGG
jgi:ribosome-binding factor A